MASGKDESEKVAKPIVTRKTRKVPKSQSKSKSKSKSVTPKYFCVFCTYSTATRSDLRRHKKSEHGYPRDGDGDEEERRLWG